MKVNGSPIQQYHIQPGPARIAYSLDYEKVQAMRAAGLTTDVFDALPGSPVWMLPGQTLSKCHVMMAYRMAKWIEAAGSEAQRRDMERKSALSKAKSRR